MLVDQREEPVAEPVQRQHVLALAGEAAAIDHPGLALEDGFEQTGPVVGVVLQIGVLNQHEVTGRGRHPAPDGCALALILRVGDDADS